MGRTKIDAAQNDARGVALKLEVKKFPRRAFLDPVAQSQELLFPLVGCFLVEPSMRSIASVLTAHGTSTFSFIIVNNTTIRLKS